MLVIYNRAEGNKVRVNRDARIVSAQFILEKCKGRDCAEVERRINVVSLTGRLASLLVLESSQGGSTKCFTFVWRGKGENGWRCAAKWLCMCLDFSC